jgi:hypothetical protein
VKDAVALENEMQRCLDNRNQFENSNLEFREVILAKYEQKTVWNAILKEYQKLD